MEFGYFAMPSHPPERDLKAGLDWDLQTMRWLDELGFVEAWIGEHHTAPWEPHPAPDLLVAQALLQTKRLRIGPGGFLLPYHHPAELANRVAVLDHPVRRAAHVRRRRVRACRATGRCSTSMGCRGKPGDDSRGAGYHPAAVERRARRSSITESFGTSPNRTRCSACCVPSPQAAATAVSADRGGRAVKELRHAEDGGRAWVPAAEPQPQPGLCRDALGRRSRKVPNAAGRTPHRRDWRMVREVFVAETDAEAMRLSTDGSMGRMMREYFLPLLGQFGFLDYLKHDPSVPDRMSRRSLRAAQLARRVAGDGGGETGTGLPRGRRLRHLAGVRIRLSGQSASLAQLTAPAGAGGCASGQTSDASVTQDGADRAASGISWPDAAAADATAAGRGAAVPVGTGVRRPCLCIRPRPTRTRWLVGEPTRARSALI